MSEEMSKDQVMLLLQAQINPDDHVLLEDEKFLVEHNGNYSLDKGNGFLLERCDYSLTTPEGIKCIGGYDQKLDGTWTADSVRRPDEDNDSDAHPLGVFATRNEAITALWLDRHNVRARV